jgi:hypothetical protein
MDEITQIEPKQLHVVVGGETANRQMMLVAARLAMKGPLLILDAGNRTAPYQLARELRRLTPDPAAVLVRIRVARAFTCHQVVALLEETLANEFTRHPVVALDLLSTFYDEDVSFGESLRLFQRCLNALKSLNQRAPVVVSARPPKAQFPQRQVLFERLTKLASHLWEENEPQPAAPQQLVLGE